MGQPLDDGRLADAGVADQDGVALRTPAQRLDDAADLPLAPDDGVELAVACFLSQVHSQLVQGRRSAPALPLQPVRQELHVLSLASAGVHCVGLDDGGHLLQDDLPGDPHRQEVLDHHAALVRQDAQQDVFRIDVVDAHLAGLDHGQLKRLLHARAERQVDGPGRGLRSPHDLPDVGAQPLGRNVQLDQGATGDAAALLRQSHQEVLRLHHGMPHLERFVVGQLDDPLASFREKLPHGMFSLKE